MKLSFTRTALLLAIFLPVYTSCKKAAVKTITTTTEPVNYAAMSSNIALTLYKSITGQFGGANINTGFSSPYDMKGGNKAAYNITPMCGLVTDTNYNYTTHTDSGTFFDQPATYSGNLGFKYLCTGSEGMFPATTVNGYIVNESTGYSQQGYGFTSSTGEQQSDTVLALNKTYKLVSMNGTIAAQAFYHYITLGEDSSLNASYVLKGLQVDLSSGKAIVSTGNATFYINDIPLHEEEQLFWTPPPPESGTIQFLGNNEVKVTIDPGYVFLVNLLTGAVTPG